MKHIMRIALAVTVVAALALPAVPASADIVHPDDVIINAGSLCVGFDCIVDMLFGFDTFVLQENNLRILFNDTSVSATFPRNDWRIIANDSALGGQNYFSLEDATAGVRPLTIMAGAGVDSLFIDAMGNVGLGTNAPEADLDIIGMGTRAKLLLGGESGAKFVVDTRNNFALLGTTGGPPRPLGVIVGGVPRMVFREDGKIGVGITDPENLLELDGGAYSDGMSWVNASSRTYKESIRELDDTEALKAVMDLEPVRFRYRNDRLEEHVGFIAEDVPALMAHGDRKGLSAMDIVAALTKVVQKQQKTIAELERRLSKLE